ncbi:putative baseplate assembly protein [Archaeoglobales archaeon]|nr:MAG: putative baseplate assembly protein [Archaeoglobales archaeon]
MQIPELDDKTFAELVEEAKKRIPQYFPEWTDHNLHDPGITLIELFAWLVEMQIFHLNQITERHYLKFLKLLGIEPRHTTPSVAQVTFDVEHPKPVLVKSGTKIDVKTDKGLIPFETIDDVWLIPVQLIKVVRKGRHLYLGFDKKFPEGKEICLAIGLRDLPEREEPDIIPSVEFLWEYSTSANSDGWAELYLTTDTTLAFSQSGFVRFRAPSDFEVRSIDGEELYWLRVRCETPPEIESVKLNTVRAVQMRKVEEVVGEATSLPNQTFQLKHSPVVPRRLVLKVRDGYRWREWELVSSFEYSGEEDEHYVLDYEFDGDKVDKNKIDKIKFRVKFGDGVRGKIPPKGSIIKVASYIYDKVCEQEFFSSNGKPNQVFELKKVPAIPKNILLWAEKDGKEEMWSEVMDFDASKPKDRHYTLNLESGEILFGDGERGRVASGVFKAIYYCGGGEIGDVKAAHILDELVDEDGNSAEITIRNFEVVEEGKKAETIEEAIMRAKRDLRRVYRVITLKDFEKLAKSTPGLRVARAKAVAKDEKVKVIVVPYGFDKPVPSEGFKQTVCRHLDNHRLVTTHVEVVDPEYVTVSVRARIKIKPHAANVKERVIERLNEFLHPLKGYNGRGWPFGRAVYKSEIYAQIEKVEGVECIQSLKLHAEGNRELFRYKNSNILLEEHVLVCSGKHQIEIIEAEVCG